jgi:hypothetical protein
VVYWEGEGRLYVVGLMYNGLVICGLLGRLVEVICGKWLILKGLGRLVEVG